MSFRSRSGGILALAIVCPCLAEEFRVPEDFLTIQEALNVTVDGDAVVVADGVYVGDGNRGLFFAGKGVTLRATAF